MGTTFWKASPTRIMAAWGVAALALVSALAYAGVGAVASSTSDTRYTYDQLGRVTSAYNPGTNLCIAYSYDANGNRTAQSNTVASTPESPTLGSGVLGCFLWTPH